MTHNTFLRMVDSIEGALCDEAKGRSRSDWVERERHAVAVEANVWAVMYDGHTVTPADVERVEPRAIGHVDYARKLALYVAELVRDGVPT